MCGHEIDGAGAAGIYDVSEADEIEIGLCGCGKGYNGHAAAWCEDHGAHHVHDDGGFEIPDDTVRRNGPIVIGQRCPWCGDMVTGPDHSMSHD